MASTVVYVHGRKNDDPDGRWRHALEDALRRGRYGSLEQRGLTATAPSWLDVLHSPQLGNVPDPERTYAALEDSALATARSRYMSRGSLLGRAIGSNVRPALGLLGDLPSDGATKAFVAAFMGDVRSYAKQQNVRAQASRRVLSTIPPYGDVVLVAHSLGSAVALDVLHALPPDVRVAALITVGSPLSVPDLRRHLDHVEEHFPFDAVQAWVNVVGVGDPVCRFRGIATHFPAAVDAFVGTGTGPPAHASSRYLGHDVMALIFDWVHEQENPPPSPSRGLEPSIANGQVLTFIRLQYIRHLEQQLKPGSEQRSRFRDARRALINELRADESDSAVAKAFGADNAHRLHGRLSRGNLLECSCSSRCLTRSSRSRSRSTRMRNGPR